MVINDTFVDDKDGRNKNLKYIICTLPKASVESF